MSDKLAKLRGLMKEYSIGAYVVPSTDEFQSEYTPEFLNRLQWLTDFTGSNGVAIVTLEDAALYTDARYLIQAKTESGNSFEILDINNKDSKKWLQSNLHGKVIGFDPMLHTKHNLEYYKKCGLKEIKSVYIEENLIDILWERPLKYQESIEILPKDIVGESTKEKLGKLLDTFSNNADYLLITDPASICWFLNIRGSDSEFNPVMLSYLLITRRGELNLFTEVPYEKLRNLGLTLEVYPLADIQSFYLNVIERGYSVQVDPNQVPFWFIKEAGAKQLSYQENPCLKLKAQKNSIELGGMKQAHIEDGIALVRFLTWLEDKMQKHSFVTEIEAADKLLELRKKSDDFKGLSFDTISAYGSNGAIIHYKPTKTSNSVIGHEALYLLDSGGHYTYGTTDVTRTLHFGQASIQVRKEFTLVLKSMINLTLAKFPIGANGSQLDGIARAYLWSNGLDYPHGTGHGVGHYLNVHEGPFNITKSARHPLNSNIVLSNEPGLYKEGEYGIRIENLVYTQESEYKGFLEFKTLTLVPISANMVEPELLSNMEKEWLKDYHERILSALGPSLNKEEIDYINRQNIYL